MGLDVFAARSPENPNKRLSRRDRRAFAKAEVELAGGMYSGGLGSFRGKLYEDLVEHITGVSLYERWIPQETVRAMAEALGRCDPDQAIAEYEATAPPYERTVFELLQLRAFFRVCAKRKLGLVGWW